MIDRGTIRDAYDTIHDAVVKTEKCSHPTLLRRAEIRAAVAEQLGISPDDVKQALQPLDEVA